MSEYLKPKEVADKLGVTIITIYRWLKAGIIPSIRPKRQIYISKKSLDEFLEGINFA